MQPPPLTVTRMPEHLISDDRRVITRPFVPGGEDRVLKIIDRVLALSEAEVAALLKRVLKNFVPRHKNIETVFEDHFREVAGEYLGHPDRTPRPRRLLIGAYFTMEYAIEAAALFNPSIVPHPDQSGVPAGELRFILSLRATGEGHVSSVAFRTGLITSDHKITFDPVSRFVEAAKKVRDRDYHKHTFFLKLIEMGAYNDFTGDVLDRLDEEFVYSELVRTIQATGRESSFDQELVQTTGDKIRWLARSNYHLSFPEDCDVSEVVIYPVTENESRGIEDARFVRFIDDDGSVMYYGTYTAYNGFHILPQLLETPDFHSFKINTLNGQFAQNKGAALFPRRIDGWYMMISRVDGENLYIMPSSNLRFWNDAQPLQTPKYPWEFVQIGNCGSPLETDAGWLMLTHGVGPMREYCIGASLLDLEDPTRVIAQTKEPLLAPNEREREGYVPNVVYSCGALIHNDVLIMPYAMSDSATSIATISVPELLEHMLRYEGV
ncbi:MAG: glycoside hydrolase family 130 protein [Phycisphaerae bacterium]|nr:glycoside hydrolase family 130 protein [Phycisphaerae bacterium]